MRLKATRKEFRLVDDSGYEFEVVCVYDDETGWSAHVAFASHGMSDEHAAIRKLAMSVERFLAMVKSEAG